METTYLLTGCTSNIGKRLVRKMIADNYKVFGLRGQRECRIDSSSHECVSIDFLQYNNWDAFTGRSDLELIHLAWGTSKINYKFDVANSAWVSASEELIDSFIRNGGKKVTVSGTCAEYAQSDRPLGEESPVLRGGSHGYANSKRLLSQNLAEKGIDILWLRNFYQYGGEERSGRVIPDMIDAFSDEKAFRIENPDDEFDFIHIEDVAEIYYNLINQKVTGIVNIGTGVGTRLCELPKLIQGIEKKRFYISPAKQVRQQRRIVADNSKLKKILPGYEFLDIRQGLSRAIAERKVNSND